MTGKPQTCLALLALLAAGAPPAGAQQAMTPAIAGVVAAGTTVELVKDGFEAVEGPMPWPDGGVLFTNNKTRQILRVAPDGAVSTWMENTGGANAVSRLPGGEVVGTLNVDVAIAALKPGEKPRVLARQFEGKDFNRPNDLTVNRRGDIYFTDSAPMGVPNPPLPSALYRLSAQGQLTRVTAAIARPNGVALSPDEKTLYVANTTGEWIIAFDVDGNGELKNQRDFAKLALPPTQQNGQPATSGADGVAVDEKGRLFVATAVGVQVIAPTGEALGTIALPKQPQNLAFSGPGKGALYVVGRGAVYRIATLTHGPDRDRK